MRKFTKSSLINHFTKKISPSKKGGVRPLRPSESATGCGGEIFTSTQMRLYRSGRRGFPGKVR